MENASDTLCWRSHAASGWAGGVLAVGVLAVGVLECGVLGGVGMFFVRLCGLQSARIAGGGNPGSLAFNQCQQQRFKTFYPRGGIKQR